MGEDAFVVVGLPAMGWEGAAAGTEGRDARRTAVMRMRSMGGQGGEK